MIRALVKGAGLAAVSRVPGGVAGYRALTRGALGTGAGHVIKQARVWPGYVRLWRDRCGVAVDGARIWLHEPGPAPLPALAAYLVSGRAAAVTGVDPPRGRYLARSVNALLALDLPVVDPRRRDAVEGLRWEADPVAAIARLGGAVHPGAVPPVPLADASIDLCHSGGALEHLPPAALAGLLAEIARVLRPGGLASHVVDHRDHLWHADKRLPFMAHLAVPEPAYRVALGGALTYHNRLSPTEVAAAFAAAGLEPVAIRRLILPAHHWVDDDDDALTGAPGLPRRALARRFRRWSDVDLRTAASHLLFRRP